MADITITAASVKKTGTTSVQQGIAGGTITAGQSIYRDTTDENKIKPAVATAAASALSVGVALNSASDDQPVTFASGGDVTYNAAFTIGTVYVVSANAAGAIAPVSDLGSGDYVTILGVANTTTNLVLKPSVSGVAIS